MGLKLGHVYHEVARKQQGPATFFIWSYSQNHNLMILILNLKVSPSHIWPNHIIYDKGRISSGQFNGSLVRCVQTMFSTVSHLPTKETESTINNFYGMFRHDEAWYRANVTISPNQMEYKSHTADTAPSNVVRAHVGRPDSWNVNDSTWINKSRWKDKVCS